uniref:phosphoglycerate mutase (2,3-diphosphoglycerate-dependent) n=1 Tax=uncultured Bacteroidota bacterium TaxID=152509 RepID=H5SM90_9BACT|nr:phosphoglycerate mutase [uncultured Bacteroidetes bacterium]
MCQQYFFLRHGEVEGDVLMGQRYDAPLSREGLAQAAAWADRLKEIPFQVVITSPALRARQTAEALAPPGVPILSLPHFEEVSWGAWEGLPRSQALPLLEDQFRRWAEGQTTWTPPQGESLEMVLKRAQEGLHIVQTLYSMGSVLIVTHGRLLQVLLCRLMGYPFSELGRFRHRRGELSWAVRLPEGPFYLRALAVRADTPL